MPLLVEDQTPPPSLWQLFCACAKISTSSFGGSVSSLIRVEFVVSKRWITEVEFHEKLALSQALPGVNVVNLTLWLGYSLRGTIGALVAVFGTILPPAVLIVTAGSFIHKAADAPLVAQFLAGVAAAALGFSINMGIRAARHALVDVASLLVFTLTVIGAFLHVPLVLIVGAMGPVSIGLAYWRLRHGKR